MTPERREGARQAATPVRSQVSALVRLLALGPFVLALALLPLPDRPWPAWLPLVLVLAASRLPCAAERRSGAGDFAVSLPFLAVGLVASARLSLAGGPALGLLGAEALVGLVLVGALSAILAGLRGTTRSVLALSTLLVLALLASAWSMGRPLLVLALELVATMLALARLAGRRAS